MHYADSKTGKNQSKTAKKHTIFGIRSKNRSIWHPKGELHMNGYYTRDHKYNGSKAASYTRPVASRLDRFLDVIYALLCALANAMRDRTVRRVLRYAVVVGCAIGFIGLIGGIDSGLISIGSGIFGGLVLLFVEILCLK
jgi:hypothetical protein